jgi:predicted anti-sigma-YlaC factor YlaD
MTEHLANQTLIDYMHAGLAPEQDAHVYAHIESCAACRSDYDAELALTDMLRTYATRETRELPSSVKAEIWERIRAARPSPLRNLADWLRPAVTLPVAAALALGIYFGTSYLGPHGAASIDAAYYLQDHAALNSTVPFSDRATASAADLESSSAPKPQSAVAVTASYTAGTNP